MATNRKRGAKKVGETKKRAKTRTRAPAASQISTRKGKQPDSASSVSRRSRLNANQGAPATIRFYCQGIGDCHLLSFPKPEGGVFRILIDCGIHPSITKGGAYIDSVVDDIVAATAPDHFVDVVVGTHEHMDHNSGFLSAAGKFKQLKFGEVWLAWTENPSDAQAKKLDKYKGQALAALQDADRRLTFLASAATDDQNYISKLAAGVRSVSGFNFGVTGEKVRSARDAIVALAPNNVRYLEPANDPIMPPAIPNMRIYVLGPPRDEKLLGIRESTSEMYGIDAGGWSNALALASALAADVNEFEGGPFMMPFEPTLGEEFASMLDKAAAPPPPGGDPADSAPVIGICRDHYVAPDDEWRRIDNDWLAISVDLALQLDDLTNNTSLVLAFEFVDSGRVLLFAADAQVGNWLSWQDAKWQVGSRTITGPELLARTVFYKVGHHGSQNATLKAKGLELMVSNDLSAFIPTNQADAKKVKWGAMPFDAIVQDLHTRASDRVIRADDPWLKQAGAAPPFQAPSGSILGVRHEPGTLDPVFKQALWVELDIG